MVLVRISLTFHRVVMLFYLLKHNLCFIFWECAIFILLEIFLWKIHDTTMFSDFAMEFFYVTSSFSEHLLQQDRLKHSLERKHGGNFHIQFCVFFFFSSSQMFISTVKDLLIINRLKTSLTCWNMHFTFVPKRFKE